MKTNWITTTALIAALSLPMTHSATADEGERGNPERRAKVLERFDTDKDGTLSETEKAAAKAARGEHQKGERPERPERGERPERPERGGKMHDEMLKKFDADGDGTLSETERTAAREAMQAKMQERKAEVLKEFDADGDGTLNETERAAAKAAMEKKRDEKMAEILANPPEGLLKRFDADKDGALSDTEKATAKTAMQERMQKRHDGRQEGREGRPRKQGEGKTDGAI